MRTTTPESIMSLPFFPLAQGGLEGLGADFADAVADLELGLPEELSVRFGGEQFGEASEVGVGGLLERLIDPLGQFGLLGS